MSFDLSFLWKNKKDYKIRFCFTSGAVTIIDRIDQGFCDKIIKANKENLLWKSDFRFERDGNIIFIDMIKVEKLVIFKG